jgi:hypothetical protein
LRLVGGLPNELGVEADDRGLADGLNGGRQSTLVFHEDDLRPRRRLTHEADILSLDNAASSCWATSTRQPAGLTKNILRRPSNGRLEKHRAVNIAPGQPPHWATDQHPERPPAKTNAKQPRLLVRQIAADLGCKAGEAIDEIEEFAAFVTSDSAAPSRRASAYSEVWQNLRCGSFQITLSVVDPESRPSSVASHRSVRSHKKVPFSNLLRYLSSHLHGAPGSSDGGYQ